MLNYDDLVLTLVCRPVSRRCCRISDRGFYVCLCTGCTSCCSAICRMTPATTLLSLYKHMTSNMLNTVWVLTQERNMELKALCNVYSHMCI